MWLFKGVNFSGFFSCVKPRKEKTQSKRLRRRRGAARVLQPEELFRSDSKKEVFLLPGLRWNRGDSRVVRIKKKKHFHSWVASGSGAVVHRSPLDGAVPSHATARTGTRQETALVGGLGGGRDPKEGSRSLRRASPKRKKKKKKNSGEISRQTEAIRGGGGGGGARANLAAAAARD